MRLVGVWLRLFLTAVAVGMVLIFGLGWHIQSRAFSDWGFILLNALTLASVNTSFAAKARDKDKRGKDGKERSGPDPRP